MQIFERRDTGMRSLLVAAAAIVLIAGLRAASDVIVPFLASAVIAVMFLPAVAWLQRKRLPDWLAVTLVFLGVLGVFAGLTVGLGASVADFNSNLDDYGDGLNERFKGPVAFITEKMNANYWHGIR